MRSLTGYAASRLRNLVTSPPEQVPTYGPWQTGMQSAMRRGQMSGELGQMGAVSSLHGIVSRLANSVSQVDWSLYRSLGPYSDPTKSMDRVIRHAALDVWARPNGFMTTQALVEITQQHIELTGEGWWITPKSVLGIPESIWPVRPDRMAPVPHPERFISGYVYTAPSGERVPLEVDDVVFMRTPDPENIYRGMSPIRSLLVDLDQTRLAAEWNRNFFLNSAEPGGVVELGLDTPLEDREYRTLRDRWREQHQGVAQAHRVAMLETGKWVERKYSMKDMDFASLRDVSRDIIREAYGFPKTMTGAVEDVNRANAEAGEAVYGKWLLVPRLERIKQALNNDLLPRFGSTGRAVEFCYESPVPEDEELENTTLTARSNAAQVLSAAGWEPEDVLAAVGLPPMRFKGTADAGLSQVDPGSAGDDEAQG